MDEDDERVTPLYDPECMYRMVALALAAFGDTTRDHEKIMAKALAFHEFIDPLGFRYNGACEARDASLPFHT
jgi:hypothetical protein